MDEWYEELDFEENPFSVNPSDFLDCLVGLDDAIEELDYRIRSGSMSFVAGKRGTGRTALLRAMIKRFRGRGRVIYVNAEKFEKKLDIEELLVQRNGFIKGMLMKKKPKKMILLMDNVNELSYRNTERLKHYFDENFLQSVVFTGDGLHEVGFSESLKLRIEGRVIDLPKLTEQQILEIVHKRLGDSKLVPDEVVMELCKRYKNNPKDVLRSLDEVAEFIVSLDEESINIKHLDEVLGEANPKKSKDSPKKNSEDVNDKAKKISNEDSSSDKISDEKETEASEIVEMLEEYGESEDDVNEDKESSSKPEESTSTKKDGENMDIDDDLDDIDAFFDEVEEDLETSSESESNDKKSKKNDSKTDDESVIVSDDVDSDEKVTDEKSNESEDDSEKQDALNKHVLVEEEVSEEKKESDNDDIFDDDFFLDDEEVEKKEDYSEDDVFDEFFEDDDEEEDK